MTTARRLHRGAGLVVGLFALAHVANHLAALWGVAAHLRFMAAARTVYRQPVAEAVLLACVALQAGSGLRLLRARRKTRAGPLAWTQALSGAYLAAFLAIHVAAVVLGRTLLDLDTNIHFAAAGLQLAPFRYVFAPYYFLAVCALCVHLGCALARRSARGGWRRTWRLAASSVAGAAVAASIVAALMGALYPYRVPKAYRDGFGAGSTPHSSTPPPPAAAYVDHTKTG